MVMSKSCHHVSRRLRQQCVGVSGRIFGVQRIERLYAISERLRRAAPAIVPAHELATELGVTRRTIERDLAALRNAGVPLYGQPGRGGGSGSVARPTRAMAIFDDAEIVALVIAAHLAADAPFAIAGRTAIAKLLDLLDEPRRIAVESLRDRFRVAVPDGVAVAPRTRSVLEDAVRAQTVVRITFVDRNGARTTRSVEPVGFYSSEGRWALVAWCRLRDGGRLFHLRGIERAAATRQRFEPRDLDDVLGWVPRPGARP
jgi:predicted DNA-binding transcriptional regulator YafY